MSQNPNQNQTGAATPMRLRAPPPPVTRLSRKVLAGIGVVVSLGVGGALIYALQTRDADKSGQELYSTNNRQPADGLAGLPRDYTGPILGPPLPGDLGRPIVDAQNRGQPVVPLTIATPRVMTPNNAGSPRKRPRAPAASSSRPHRAIPRRPQRRQAWPCPISAGLT
jgi:type IV secretion system protein VirB10